MHAPTVTTSNLARQKSELKSRILRLSKRQTMLKISTGQFSRHMVEYALLQQKLSAAKTS